MKSESFTWPPVLYQVHGFYVNKLYFIGTYPPIIDDPIIKRSAFYLVEAFCNAAMVRQEFIDDDNCGYYTNIEDAKAFVGKKLEARIKEIKCQK